MATGNAVDPVPLSAYPSFQPVTTPAPSMPSQWTATVLLQPFSPPQTDPSILPPPPPPPNPFFQLCVANVDYIAGDYMSIQVAGCEYGTWWYIIYASGTTQLSIDGGTTWTDVDMGWSLPTDWYGAEAQEASCAGASPLNWMSDQSFDWWKTPVPPATPPAAATWMWTYSGTSIPVRMMFGQGPPTPTMGDPTQLAFFQMFSFTYFPVFVDQTSSGKREKPTTFTMPTFDGFAIGNPNGYQNFVFNGNMGFTAFMTPVNEAFNPLPTRVLYVWKADAEYAAYSDRAQHTLMDFTYNPSPAGLETVNQQALLTGPAPAGVTPPQFSDEGFLITTVAGGAQTCVDGNNFPFPQEAPGWISIPGAQATIQATITNNPVIAPNTTVTVYSVLFPPSGNNYPNSTYLWTWYAPQSPDGLDSRPVTFMQSQSGVGVGTSLALADYFYHENFVEPIDPANFAVPVACQSQS